jgi:hypothetical protein
MEEIKIDPEFKSLIPEMAAEEKASLEKSILEEGCRDPLVTWDNILLDGHNRHEICTRHGLDFKTVPKVFKDRDQAKLWIINNQLGRRNLTPEQVSYLRGQEKLLTETEQGRDPMGHFEPAEVSNKKLAEKHGVSTATIKRDADFAKAVDQLSAEEKAKVLAGKSDKTKQEIIQNLKEGPERDGIALGGGEAEGC